ncbi:MAG TPA: hypothetical protein VFZ65_13985 [Planctomycetota bacterium]|nr:hypothetical protein [Planctomycetota bacterium]
MAPSDEDLGLHHADAAFELGGLLLRAAVYTFVYSISGLYDCGRPLLTGLLVGDMGSQLVALAWQWRHGFARPLADLAVLGVVYLWVRSQLVWPDELSLRAVLGLAAFGVFTTRFARACLASLGPGESDFA